MRLRQVAFVAANLDPVVSDLCSLLGVEVGFNDPGVSEFGLVNVVMPVGDTFLEVVAPTKPGTTAGRLLEKRGGDGGYMVILQVDDLDGAMARVDHLGIRTVWRGDIPAGEGDAPAAHGRHLHPRDIGGAILSLDAMEPPQGWRWAGPRWRVHVRDDVTTGIATVEVQAQDPTAMAARWAEALGQSVGSENTIALDFGTAIRFAPVADERGEGVSGIDVTVVDPARAGEEHLVCGARIRLVKPA